MRDEKYFYLQQLVIPVMQAQIVQSPLPTFLKKNRVRVFYFMAIIFIKDNWKLKIQFETNLLVHKMIESFPFNADVLVQLPDSGVGIITFSKFENLR